MRILAVGDNIRRRSKFNARLIKSFGKGDYFGHGVVRVRSALVLGTEEDKWLNGGHTSKLFAVRLPPRCHLYILRWSLIPGYKRIWIHDVSFRDVSLSWPLLAWPLDYFSPAMEREWVTRPDLRDSNGKAAPCPDCVTHR